MRIVLGTTSKIKIQAIRELLDGYLSEGTYSLISYDVESEVTDTPYDSQTLQGARNRAKSLIRNHRLEGELFVGLESGIVEREDMLFEECWGVIYDNEENEHVGYSSGFMLPKIVTSEMKKGRSHVEVMRELADELEIDRKDTWATYSHNKIKRIESIKEAFRNAFLLIPSDNSQS